MRRLHVIEARGLTKRYGDKVAVDDLTFTVRPGIVTGFLGPNGAGKSTTMRMLLGLDAPSAGSATIGGRRYADQKAPLREVGALLEAKAIHTGRSARNHLLALAATTGISRAPGTRGHRSGRPHRRCRQAGRRLLARHGPAARHRVGIARRPGHVDSRRTGERARPRRHLVDPQPAQGTGGRRVARSSCRRTS